MSLLPDEDSSDESIAESIAEDGSSASHEPITPAVSVFGGTEKKDDDESEEDLPQGEELEELAEGMTTPGEPQDEAESQDEDESAAEEEVPKIPAFPRKTREERDFEDKIIIVPDDERQTSDVLSLYEMAEVLSIRSDQIARTGTILAKYDKTKQYTAIELAKMELQQRIIPLKIRREVGKELIFSPPVRRIFVELWSPNEMIFARKKEENVSAEIVPATSQ
ncbi:MAG: hypothetical protein M0R33_15225 [Methylomonas sp.]|jgi:hypothetical protein|uniref:hypothetical protein n=1 Tax=Methylomonas sp. TaxID=418 RepID=UPI0025CD1B0D|nr:hypothetical protein [Methylomonas sp.]MCK9607793.1 hypothetical protein [Methylomonas sp.]